MSQRILGAGALAPAFLLAFALLAGPSALAKGRLHSRTKCIGVYCAIVPANPTKPHGHRHAPTKRFAASMPADMRAKPAQSSSSRDLVAAARRYVGTNPTGWARLWCGRFMALIAPDVARRIHNPNFARDWEALPHVAPRVNAIAVIHRGRGGHVGVVSGFDDNGNPILIAGNAGGGRVREYPVPRARISAYVAP